MTAPAIFKGVQEGIAHLPAVELYTLTAPVGVHPAGSTVSRGTLERHGYAIDNQRPETRGQRLEVCTGSFQLS